MLQPSYSKYSECLLTCFHPVPMQVVACSSSSSAGHRCALKDRVPAATLDPSALPSTVLRYTGGCQQPTCQVLER
jgi:hypothetical protein